MHWGNEIIDHSDVEEMNRKVENMTVKEIRSFITAGHAFLIYGDDHWAILNQIPSELNNNNTNMKSNENITFKIQRGGSMTVERTIRHKKASWRFQSLIRLADSMNEERLIYLCFEATDDEFDKAIEELGGKVVRYKENPKLTPVDGANNVEMRIDEIPAFKGVWKQEEE